MLQKANALTESSTVDEEKRIGETEGNALPVMNENISDEATIQSGAAREEILVLNDDFQVRVYLIS